MALTDLTAGVIELRLQPGDSPDGNVLVAVDDSSGARIRVYISSGKLYAEGYSDPTSGTPEWRLHSDSALPTRMQTLHVYHTGSAVVFYQDGDVLDTTADYSGDLTYFFGDMNAVHTVAIGAYDALTSWQGTMAWAAIMGTTMRQDQQFNLLLHEGAGAPADSVSGATAVLAGGDNAPSWTAAITPAAITAVLETRGYDFGAPGMVKTGVRVELDFQHLWPRLTMLLRGEQSGDDETIWSAVTYDKTAYDVHGHAAWDEENPNDNALNQGREDYLLTLPADGVRLTSANGLPLNWMRRRRKRAFSMARSTHFRVRISNDRGLLWVRGVQLENNSQQRMREL